MYCDLLFESFHNVESMMSEAILVHPPLISFVIPAYNAAPCLAACLDSIFSLAWEPSFFEVLVIDDGSTDDTARILAEYAGKYGNMRCFRQKNQGQSVARNLGIEKAMGDYLYFVDADDTLSDAAEFPLDIMEAAIGAESVCGDSSVRGAVSDKEGGPSGGASGSSDGVGASSAVAAPLDIIGVEVLKIDLAGKLQPYSRQWHPYGVVYTPACRYLEHHNVLGIVYGYLFRREFLLRSGIRFPVGIYHQDEEFVVRAFCAADGFVYSFGYTYIYIMREGSSIHTFTPERKERLMGDMIQVLHRLTEMADNDPRMARVMRYKLSYMAADVLRLLIRQRHSSSFVDFVISELRKMRLYPLPALSEWRFTVFRILTACPSLVKALICHPEIARIGRF